MSIKYGLLAGFLIVLFYLIAYFISIELFLSQGLYWITLAVYIGAMYMLALETVKEQPLNFREIVRPLFVCFLLANAIYYLFYYIMITYVDPSIYELQISKMASGFSKMKMEQKDMSFQLSHYILSYFQAAIGGFVVASAIAYSKKQS